MFHFKHPNEFATVLPPVPDIKAWVQDFRSKNPQQNRTANYEKQISSLHAEKDRISMEFETMHLSNCDINKNNASLNTQLSAMQGKLQNLEQENVRLRQQNQQQSQHIQRLEQQLANCSTKSDVSHMISKPDNNNAIAWNFNVDGKENNTTTTASNIAAAVAVATSATQKRDSPEIETESAAVTVMDTTKDADKPLPTNTTTTLDRDRDSSSSLRAPSIESMKDILDKRLPSNLDLIRGDILAEAAGNDQLLYSLNLLQKCTTDEWELRNFLMQMIGGLCEENRAVDCALVYDARHLIKKQLTDLRSTIVKSACEMLVMFSRYCDDSNKFAQCLTHFIPIHLDGLYITIACIRDAHQQCLTHCISNTRSFKCIQVLLKTLPSKHCLVRVAVIDLLSLLLQNIGNEDWNQQNFKMDKYADAIANVIRTYITDSKSDVRKSVKRLFENFAVCFPQKARQALSNMDMNSQKTLKKCMANQKSEKTQRKNNNSVNNKYSMNAMPKTRRK